MRGNIHLRIITVMTLFCGSQASGADLWQPPFEKAEESSVAADSVLSLDDILTLVAEHNPAFESFNYQLIAARSDFKQAGLWTNPELSVEFEEIGWNAPGFKEHEFSLALSQEFELFGKRKAREGVAQARIDGVSLQIKLAAFDLYLETKLGYYTLAHAQRSVALAEASVALDEEIVKNITTRLDRGAALQSELLLACLEKDRAQLKLDGTREEVLIAEATLVSLWNGNQTHLRVVTGPEADFSKLMDQVAEISNQSDSTRAIMLVQAGRSLLSAEKKLAQVSAKPNLTLSGGFKRFEADNSKSFLLGFALPLPLFDRNQGTREELDARLKALEYTRQQATIKTRATIQGHTIRLNQLMNKHATLDFLLLPTAEKAYHTLQKAYDAGRVPFTQLLEAERSHNELSFEHNDALLEIIEQIIALEQITGVVLRIDWEN